MEHAAAEALKLILTDADISNSARVSLWDGFWTLDDLALAKLLHRRAEVPDAVKGQILMLKLSTPTDSSDRDIVFSDMVSSAAESFWSRLGQAQAVKS